MTTGLWEGVQRKMVNILSQYAMLLRTIQLDENSWKQLINDSDPEIYDSDQVWSTDSVCDSSPDHSSRTDTKRANQRSDDYVRSFQFDFVRIVKLACSETR